CSGGNVPHSGHGCVPTSPPRSYLHLAQWLMERALRRTLFALAFGKLRCPSLARCSSRPLSTGSTCSKTRTFHPWLHPAAPMGTFKPPISRPPRPPTPALIHSADAHDGRLR